MLGSTICASVSSNPQGTILVIDICRDVVSLINLRFCGPLIRPHTHFFPAYLLYKVTCAIHAQYFP